MELLNNIKDNTIILCENNYKEKILKLLTINKIFLNIKFYTKEEFLNNYFFSYDEKSLYYLCNKYNYKVSVAKKYLKNLIYIDENKTYYNKKLDLLVSIKKELLKENLLIFNDFFKKSINNKNIIILGYEYLEKYELDIFNSIHANILYDNYLDKTFDICFCPSIENEVELVAKKICELIQKNVNINNIKIANINEDYYPVIERIFSFYNIPINIPYKNSLYSLEITKLFLDNYDSDINSSINKIKKYDSDIVNTIVNICNKYYFVNNYLDVKNLIIEDLKNTNIYKYELNNYVEVLSYNELFISNDYVFLMNFNNPFIPVIYKDEDYITDNIKPIVNLDTTYEINKKITSYVINKISNIDNIFITCKDRSNKEKCYPSILLSKIKVNNIKYYNDITNSYSVLNDKISYAKKLDNLRKYNIIDNDLLIYQNSIKDMSYDSYNNKYHNIDVNDLKEYLLNKLTLSYTSLSNYYKCAFRYYLANILKIDKYEINFEAFIGSVFHDVLEKCFCTNNISVTNEINNYIKRSNREITIKERFFLNKITEDIIYTINVLKKQANNISLNESLYEKNISISKDRDNVKIDFIGFIDKLLYKENTNNTLVSIIDYKTGYVDTDLKYLPYGLNMQLPIYLYLVKKASLFNNPIFLGFYIQYILDKDIKKDINKSYDKQREDKLKLDGYSLKSDLLAMFDNSYIDSSLIKSMKVTKAGSFYSYSKVLDQNQIDNIINITDDKIEEAITKILNTDFSINPKKIEDIDIGCKYCKFKDICFRKEEDYEIIPKIEDISFLGGEENELD